MLTTIRESSWVGRVLGTLVGLGAFAVAVWYIQGVWWLVVVHGFGGPMIDFWSALGLLGGLLPFIALALLSVRTGDK